MATNSEDSFFAAVTATGQELKTKFLRIPVEEIEHAKGLVTDEMGEENTIEIPEEEDDEIDQRSVLFRCVDRHINQVRYPTPEEAQTLFQET